MIILLTIVPALAIICIAYRAAMRRDAALSQVELDNRFDERQM